MNDIFKTVTVEDFKQYFFRDFSYLPKWCCCKTYMTGDIVYYEETNSFYKSLTDDNETEPTDTTNWQRVQGNKYDYITDEDIAKAMTQARVSANDRFGADDNEKVYIFLHLVAFYLVMDWKNAAAGAASAYAGFTASKSVGDVSESYNFPTWLTNSPMYSLYSTNGFGMKYLSLILPYLSCTILFSTGRSTMY